MQVFAHKKSQIIYLGFLLLLTIIYLMGEISFSAWLLDTLADNPDTKAIHQAENLGRIVSGIAVALAILPSIIVYTTMKQSGTTDEIYFKLGLIILFPMVVSFLIWGWTILIIYAIFLFVFYLFNDVDSFVSRLIARFCGILLRVIFPVVLIIWSVFHAEKKFIDNMTENSTAEQRMAAVNGEFLQKAFLTNSISKDKIEGLWTKRITESTEGRAFASVTSFIVANSDEAMIHVKKLQPDILPDVVNARLGGWEGELRRFNESKQALMDGFNEYVDNHPNYKKEAAEINKKADEAWEKYLDSLERKHRNWGRYQIDHPTRDGSFGVPKVWPEIRKSVRDKGIPVPDTWNTGDKKTFLRLAKTALTNKARATYLQGLPPDLDVNAYAAQPIVQDHWRKALNYPDTIGRLSLNYTDTQFISNVYNKVFGYRVSNAERDYGRSVKFYNDGEIMSEPGKLAFKSMVAATLALVLSILGMLVHALKSLFIFVHMTTGWHMRSALMKSAIIIMTVGAIMWASSVFIQTPLTDHPTYQAWITNEAKTSFSDKFAMTSVDAMIKLQSLLFPISDAVKSNLMPVWDALDWMNLDTSMVELME